MGSLTRMDEPSPHPFPADEIIVRVYRRLLGMIGGIGIFLVLVRALPPMVESSLLTALPMAAFGLLCLWTRQALRRPRALTYWGTVIGFGGVVASVIISSLLHGDLLTTLFTVFVWSGPLRALSKPAVRRALSGDDHPSGGLRRRLREAQERLGAILQPGLRPQRAPAPA